MSIFGALVKKGIELNQRLSFESESAGDQQEKQLKELLNRAKNTAFGKFYGFDELLKEENVIAAFKKEVLIFD